MANQKIWIWKFDSNRFWIFNHHFLLFIIFYYKITKSSSQSKDFFYTLFAQKVCCSYTAKRLITNMLFNPYDTCKEFRCFAKAEKNAKIDAPFVTNWKISAWLSKNFPISGRLTTLFFKIRISSSWFASWSRTQHFIQAWHK